MKLIKNVLKIISLDRDFLLYIIIKYQYQFSFFLITDEEFALNEPSDPRYEKKQKRGKAAMKDKVNRGAQPNTGVDDEEEQAIICAFCKESINNLEAIKKLGWFYGPFKHKKHDYYVHLMCAIWTPAVYLHEESNKMMNIKKEIQRSNKIMCKSCGLLGAGLGCKVDNCKQSFHFKCALSENIETRLDHVKYELYCPNHGHILDEKVENEIENVHCESCKVDENEDLILLCDNCDKAFHTYCLENKLDSIPEGDWFCPECSDKNPRPPQPPSLPNPTNNLHINSKQNLSRGFSFSKIQATENMDSQKSNKSKDSHPHQFNLDFNSQSNTLKRDNSKNNYNSQHTFNQINSQNNNNTFSQSDNNLWNAPLSPIIQAKNSENSIKQSNNLFDEDKSHRKNVGLGDLFFN